MGGYGFDRGAKVLVEGDGDGFSFRGLFDEDGEGVALGILCHGHRGCAGVSDSRVLEGGEGHDVSLLLGETDGAGAGGAAVFLVEEGVVLGD